MKRTITGFALLLAAAGSLFAASLPVKGPVRPNALDVDNPFIENFVHREGIVCLNITNWGVFGNYGAEQTNPGPMVDPCSDEWAPQGEYPCGSGQQYLYQGALWIGALVTDSGYTHPRVSVGIDGWFNVNEMFPGEGEENGIVQHSNIPGRLDCDSADIYDPQARANEEFVAEYSDTLTDPFWFDEDPIDGPHRPLGIEVTQTSMAWSSPEFDDFIVFEFRLQNIGTDSLQNVYLGLFVDGDVGLWNEFNHHTDDITGFLATDTLTGDTFNIAYIADNDGRPFFEPNAPLQYPHVAGMYVLEAPQQNLKWSYNWWVPNGDPELDYGPTWAGNGGTPVGDSAKYAVLSNGERDFDQIYTADNPYIQSHPQLYHDPCTGEETWHDWQTPDTPDAPDIANGYDTRYLISFGPLGIFDHVDPDGQCIYRLNPGEETTLTVAFVFGMNFHDSSNPQIDPNQIDPSRFHFANLLHNARRARMMFEHNYAYQPPVPPPNFRPTGTLDGAVPLAWSPPQVGTVQGYDVFGFSLAEPNDTVHFNAQLITDTTFTVTDLGNGEEGILLVRTTDDSGLVSDLADTLVRVGAPLPVTGLATTLDSSVVHLSWDPCSDPLLTQYRVLRRSDHGDSTSFVTTAASYTDFSAMIGRIYIYWVVAENSRNLMSYPSVPVTAIPWDPNHRILVIDDTDDIHGPIDTLRGGVSGDSVAALYLRLMNASGQEYDILNQPDGDSLVFAFDTLAHYDVVIWHAEDNRQLVGFQYIEEREQIFQQYAAAGGRLLRVARRFLSGKLNIPVGYVNGDAWNVPELLAPLTFDSLYAWPQYNATQPRIEFVGANADVAGFPNVQIDTARVNALRWGNTHLPYLPEIDAFWPNDGTYPLYRFVVLPEDSSGLGNQPCAVIGHGEIILAFPLYFLHENEAQALLNASINALRTYSFDVPHSPRVPLPTTTALEQNYPNPFNPSTTLRFTLAKTGPVHLAIYNLLGQQVRVLVDQPMTEGSHQLTWDGEGAAGQTLPSGVYLARLQAVDATHVIKLMLLR